MMTQLHYSPRLDLFSVLSIPNSAYVLYRYTSGDVRLWDTVHWDSGALYLKPAHTIRDDSPPPHVGFVRVSETLASAAYENGERCGSFNRVALLKDPIHGHCFVIEEYISRFHVLEPGKTTCFQL